MGKWEDVGWAPAELREWQFTDVFCPYCGNRIHHNNEKNLEVKYEGSTRVPLKVTWYQLHQAPNMVEGYSGNIWYVIPVGSANCISCDIWFAYTESVDGKFRSLVNGICTWTKENRRYYEKYL